MITKVIMPKIGFTMEEGFIAKWLKNIGDKVNHGEPLLEISSDKANIEIEASEEGYLRKILANEGETVAVMSTIAYIGELDEPIPEDEAAAENQPEVFDTVKAAAETLQNNVNPHKNRLSPRARKFVNENKISIEQNNAILGTGVNGMIVERDIKCQFDRKPELKHETITAPSKLRQIIARRLTESVQEIPQFVAGVEVDMTAIQKFRERLNERTNSGKVSLTCLLIKCLARAIRENMNVNVSWNNGQITVLENINIGIAVASDSGLVVPVINSADRKGLFEISNEFAKLIGKSKEGKLAPAEMSGGTFTISNLGMFEVDKFQAIINPPESGILAVGRIVNKPVVSENGDIVARPMMWINLTSDHRVIDGADAAKLLGSIKLYVEFPEMLIG